MKIEVERNMDASFEGSCQSCGAGASGRHGRAIIKTVNMVRVHASIPCGPNSCLTCIRLCDECLPKFAEAITEAMGGETPIEGPYWCFDCGGILDGPDSTCTKCSDSKV